MTSVHQTTCSCKTQTAFTLYFMRHHLRAALAVAAGAAAFSLAVAWRSYRGRAVARRSLACVGFAGLGNMGSPMALRLLRHLNGVLTVWNRSEAKASALQAEGALVAPSLRFLCQQCDTVCLMLLGDEATREAVDELLSVEKHLVPAMAVNFGTISPGCATQCAERCATAGCVFVSCPVTGRPDRAAAGTLSCWVSAADASAAAVVAEELCPAVATHVAVVSTTDAAAAATFKLVTNLLVYGGVELLAECTTLAEGCGLPRGAVAQFLGVLAPGTFLEGYAAKIRDRAYDRAATGMDVGIKDMRLIRDLARGAKLPVLEAALEHCMAASAAVGSATSTREWCALAEEVERRAMVQRGCANSSTASMMNEGTGRSM